MGTVFTIPASTLKGETMTTKPVSERRIAKKVTAVKQTGEITPPPAKEVRRKKVAPKPEASAQPAQPKVKEVRKAEQPEATEAPAPEKPKRTKAEARAIAQHNKVTPTEKDWERLEGNLLILDEYGPDAIDQLTEYFGSPFADGGAFDPTTANVTGKSVVMWTVPYRRKMEATGVDGKDGKFLKFQRYELSLIGHVEHDGKTYVVLYPLDGDVAAAIPSTEWHKVPTPVALPTDEEQFNKFLTEWAERLKNGGGSDLTV